MQFSWQGELLPHPWLVPISLSRVYIEGMQNQLCARNVYEMTLLLLCTNCIIHSLLVCSPRTKWKYTVANLNDCIDSENKSHFNVTSHYSLHLSRHSQYRINNNNPHILRAPGSFPDIPLIASRVHVLKLKSKKHKATKKKNQEKCAAETATGLRLAQILLFS